MSNPYDDHPGKGFTPVDGYTPPGGSMAEQQVKDAERAAENSRRQDMERQHQAMLAQQEQANADAARRVSQQKAEKRKREEDQRKRQAKASKGKQQQRPKKNTAHSTSEDADWIDSLIALAGGGGGIYLASISGMTGWWLIALGAAGATGAYLARGLIKLLLVAAIVLFVAIQYFQ